MEEQHTLKVVTLWRESDFVNSDLVPGGYGSGSLAWPHGQRTPTRHLAQHPELVVGGSEAVRSSWRKGHAREGGLAGRKTEPRSW